MWIKRLGSPSDLSSSSILIFDVLVLGVIILVLRVRRAICFDGSTGDHQPYDAFLDIAILTLRLKSQ